MSKIPNRILFLDTDPRHIGGIEAFARNLNSAIDKEITFISLKRIKREKETYDMKNVLCIKRNSLEQLFQKNSLIRKIRVKRINRILARLKPQTIIINSPATYDYIKNIDAADVILIQHTTAALWKKRKIYFDNNSELIRRIGDNVDKIVCLSPHDMEDVAKIFSFDKKKLSFIRHSTEMSIRKDKKPNNKKLVMISRFNNEIKRFDLAINAMSLLQEYELHIYGSGKDEALIKDLAKSQNNVFVHGPTSDVQSVLDENSIYVSTSDFEGYPISSIEAIRRGLPIVLRNTHSSALDIIDNNGILLEAEWSSEKFADAVNKISSSYEQYSKAATQKAPLYDFINFKEAWEKLLS